MKKTVKFLYHLVILVVLLIFIVSCHEIVSTTELTDINDDVIIENTPNGSPIINNTIISKDYPPHLIPGQEAFDWENLEYLPLSPYAKAPIPLPWTDKAKRCFSDDIRYDFKKSDGWELYSCTFSKEIFAAVNTFILYNRYRGVLRYYYYLTGTGIDKVKDFNILSNSILAVGSHASMSPSLNFAHQKIVDINKNSILCTTIDLQSISDSTWYVWENEIAFDKDIYNQNPGTLMLGFAYYMLKKNVLLLNGKPISNLNTKVRFSDTQYGYGDSYSGDVNLLLYGKNDLNQVSSILSASDLSSLKQIYNQQSFNELLNGTIDSSSEGEIQWDANISITTAPSGVGLTGGNETFAVSGADNSVMQGMRPFYTKALGVFYLNAKPKVTYSKLADENRQHQYEFNANSVEYLFNPSVTEIADIKNITQEIVATQNAGLFENYSRAKLFIGQKLTSNLPLTIQGVRVGFDVVPKDGSKKVHIVKTFQADIIVAK